MPPRHPYGDKELRSEGSSEVVAQLGRSGWRSVRAGEAVAEEPVRINMTSLSSPDEKRNRKYSVSLKLGLV
ncbi:hypothetical protein NL676_020445 [Syzygium grande]|nr:hypothetical protein NL676_020445 [Syzygium grande]